MDFEVARELERNKFDKVACEVELENAKKNVAKEILNDVSQYDIAQFVRPQKFKKPLRVRIKQKLKRFFGGIIDTLAM